MFLFFVDAQLMNGDTCADRNFVVFFFWGGVKAMHFWCGHASFFKVHSFLQSLTLGYMLMNFPTFELPLAV